MRTVYITRKESFNAAHKLWHEAWSEEKNFEVFGKCANPNWHGHNYTLYVTVKGVPDPVTGFCIDLKKLSKLIKENVTDVFDHKNLNLDIPFLKNIKPSTENLCIVIWDILQPLINNDHCKLYAVKLWETENNYAEYLGE
jgi:6-pyruvoyltetrahydropterin/6-carboxytetrahydropterin synthase